MGLSFYICITNKEEQAAMRNLARGLQYEWSEQPNSNYMDSTFKLTDGKHGALHISDPAWVGHHRGKTREVVFDLGSEKSISAVKVRFMQDWPKNNTLVPLAVSMYVSDDKEHWGLLSHNPTKLLWGDGPTREEIFAWDGGSTMAYARYVKVTFTVHTRAFQLLDEIEIWGDDGKAEGAVKIKPDTPAFQQSGEATGGIRNLILLYNGHYSHGKGDWPKERIIPNISYVDEQGNPVDWLFDGVLYLGISTPDGKGMDGPANMNDWTWYLDKTFAEHGDLQQLNEATKEVGLKLNQPERKTKVVLMIPDTGEYLTDFGDVDGDGISENFNASEVGEQQAVANMQKVIRWYIEALLARWQSKNYSNLELAGLYWLSEQVSTSESGPEFLRFTSDLVHSKSLKLFWIPHFLAYKMFDWKEVGIDAVTLQPNYYFEEMDHARIEDASGLAKQYGMGVELEFDEHMLTDDSFRKRYIEYLNGGVTHGYMKEAFKGYYQGCDAVYALATSQDPINRKMYDWLYQFIQGTYTVQEVK